MDNLLFKIEVQGLEEEIKEIGRLKSVLIDMKAEEKALNDERRKGNISIDDYNKQSGKLTLSLNNAKKELTDLTKSTQAQGAAFEGAVGSMNRLSQELGKNRDLYRSLTQAERENAEIGGKLLTTIQGQDTQIKKLDATLGNHQRSVGNYEKVWHGVLELESYIVLNGKAPKATCPTRPITSC